MSKLQSVLYYNPKFQLKPVGNLGAMNFSNWDVVVEIDCQGAYHTEVCPSFRNP